MGKIKTALKGRLRKFSRALGYEVRFGGLKRGLVGEAKSIFQDPGFRVNVVVIAAVLGHVSRGREYCG
jgi:hypothetical protein